MYSGQIGQTLYSKEMAHALPGMIEGMGNYRGYPYINGASGTQPTYTITPPATPDANSTYKIVVDGTTVSVPTGGSTTTAQLGAAIFSALRQDPLVFRKADISLNAGTGVVTLTSLLINVPLTITSNSSETTGDLTIANTVAAGTEVTIPYGRFVGRRATYGYHPIDGLAFASLIDDATAYTATGAAIVGVTMKSFQEKTGRGPTAQGGYPFMSTMSVLDRCSEIEGIFVETVEADIKRSDPVRIAVSAGNQGKVTKSTSGTVDIQTIAQAKYMSDAIQVVGTTIALVHFNL